MRRIGFGYICGVICLDLHYPHSRQDRCLRIGIRSQEHVDMAAERQNLTSAPWGLCCSWAVTVTQRCLSMHPVEGSG